MKRPRRAAVAVGVALATAACGGAGTVATAPAGELRQVLRVAAADDTTETAFTGLTAAPDGTVYLGITPDSYDFDRNPKILALRPGGRPKAVLEVRDEGVQGADSVETGALAVGRDGELLVGGYTDTAIVIVSIRPDGKQRVIQGPPATADDYSAGRSVVALAADPRNGDLYLTDGCSVFRAPEGGAFSVLAGGPDFANCNTFDSHVPGVLYSFSRISGLAVDPRTGAVYVSDGAVQVFRIEESAVTAVAGRGKTDLDARFRGFSGDGGPATEARLDHPTGLAVDPANGDLYISDGRNRRVRRVDAAGTITTVAGNGAVLSGSRNGPSSEVILDPGWIAIDGRGRLYATDGQTSSFRNTTARRLAVATVRKPN